MKPITQSVQVTEIQQKQTVEHKIKQLLGWVNSEISKKNLPQLNSIQDLASGNIFLQILSMYYPKKVDLTKTYMKPKDDFEILQNYKQLLSAFIKLGCNKFDPEKFRKRKDKDLIQFAEYLKKFLGQHLFGDTEQTTVHNLLASFPSSEKITIPKHMNETIKIQDRKNSKIQSAVGHEVHKGRESESHKKKGDSLKSNQKAIGRVNPSKGMHQGGHIVSSNLQKMHVKEITSPKLPPHPHLSAKNLIPNASTLKKQQQQLNSFENMKITKLEKEKKLLLRKISQIQQIIRRQRVQLKKTVGNQGLLSNLDFAQNSSFSQNGQDAQNGQRIQNQISEHQKTKIQKIKGSILALLSDVSV